MPFLGWTVSPSKAQTSDKSAGRTRRGVVRALQESRDATRWRVALGAPLENGLSRELAGWRQDQPRTDAEPYVHRIDEDCKASGNQMFRHESYRHGSSFPSVTAQLYRARWQSDKRISSCIRGSVGSFPGRGGVRSADGHPVVHTWRRPAFGPRTLHVRRPDRV
jgi:hypothetical protein